MIFVKQNNYASAYLRADQIAKQLGADVLYDSDIIQFNPEEMPSRLEFGESDTIVIVKDCSDRVISSVDHGWMQDAKIVYDPIDNFAYAERLKHKDWYSMVDVCIAYNQVMANLLRPWFKEIVIIPHQWDARIKDQCSMKEFKPGYIGHSFNWPKQVPRVGFDFVTDPNVMLSSAAKFNCHISLRVPGSLEAKMKPATKVSIAAAVGAVIITTRDASAVELLPEDYPYWCDLGNFYDVFDRAKSEFNGKVWTKALMQLAEVKEKTSIEAVSKLYLEI